MKSYFENGWTVTTPVLVGHSEDVAKARNCKHEWEETKHELPNGMEIFQDKCKHCIAMRGRYRSPKGEVANV